MRVILDTNVIISGLARQSSPPGKLLKAWVEGRFELLICEQQIAEIRRVTRYAKLAPRLIPSNIGRAVNELRESALMISRLPIVDASPDPMDNYLLGLAQAGSADLLVSGDKADLLSLEIFRATKIVSVRSMVEILKL